jgi:hypothetical protein
MSSTQFGVEEPGGPAKLEHQRLVLRAMRPYGGRLDDVCRRSTADRFAPAFVDAGQQQLVLRASKRHSHVVLQVGAEGPLWQVANQEGECLVVKGLIGVGECRYDSFGNDDDRAGALPTVFGKEGYHIAGRLRRAVEQSDAAHLGSGGCEGSAFRQQPL